MNIRPLTVFMIDEHKIIMDEALFSFTYAASNIHKLVSVVSFLVVINRKHRMNFSSLTLFLDFMK